VPREAVSANSSFSVEAREACLQACRGVRQHLEWAKEQSHVGEEHHEIARREATRDDLHAAVPEQCGRCGGNEELPSDLDAAGPPPDENLRARLQVRPPGEARRLRVLARKAAYHADAAERLRRVSVDLVAHLLEIPIDRPDPPDPRAVAEPDHRQEHDRADQQPPIREGEDHEASGELDHRAERVVEEPEEQLARGSRVLADQARDAASLEFVHARKRQMDRLRECPTPQRDL